MLCIFVDYSTKPILDTLDYHFNQIKPLNDTTSAFKNELKSDFSGLRQQLNESLSNSESYESSRQVSDTQIAEARTVEQELIEKN